MNKNKEALAIKLNLEFDEVVSLFSEETLSSMEQDDLLGGGNTYNTGNCVAGCDCGTTVNVFKCNLNLGCFINGIFSCNNNTTTPAPGPWVPPGGNLNCGVIPTTTPAP